MPHEGEEIGASYPDYFEEEYGPPSADMTLAEAAAAVGGSLFVPPSDWTFDRAYTTSVGLSLLQGETDPSMPPTSDLLPMPVAYTFFSRGVETLEIETVQVEGNGLGQLWAKGLLSQGTPMPLNVIGVGFARGPSGTIESVGQLVRYSYADGSPLDQPNTMANIDARTAEVQDASAALLATLTISTY
jgi:hypothetical protein